MGEEEEEWKIIQSGEDFKDLIKQFETTNQAVIMEKKKEGENNATNVNGTSCDHPRDGNKEIHQIGTTATGAGRQTARKAAMTIRMLKEKLTQNGGTATMLKPVVHSTEQQKLFTTNGVGTTTMGRQLPLQPIVEPSSIRQLPSTSQATQSPPPPTFNMNGEEAEEVNMDTDTANSGDIQPTYLTRHFIKKISPNDLPARETLTKEESRNKVTGQEEAKIKSTKKKKKLKTNGTSTGTSPHIPRKRGRPSKKQTNMVASSINTSAASDQTETTTSTTTPPSEHQPTGLPHKLSKREQEAINFAMVNPLIVLCEVATREQEKEANAAGKLPNNESSEQAQMASTSLSTTLPITSTKQGKKRVVTSSDYAAANGMVKKGGDVEVETRGRQHFPPPSPLLFAPAPSWAAKPGPSTDASSSLDLSESSSTAHAEDESVYRYRLRMMSTTEARDHLTIACLNALCSGQKLDEMRIVEENNGEAAGSDGPFNFNLPKACLKLLSPASVEALVEVAYDWIDHWIRTIDGRLGIELRAFSRIDQMRWILGCALPQLCIFYLKKTKKINSDEAKRLFLAMGSSDIRG